jgi:Phage integrase family
VSWLVTAFLDAVFGFLLGSILIPLATLTRYYEQYGRSAHLYCDRFRQALLTMRDWCNQAGLTRCSAHGLRKAAATIAANNGATAHQLMAIFGWKSLKQAENYTRKADRKRSPATGCTTSPLTESGTKLSHPKLRLQQVRQKGVKNDDKFNRSITGNLRF